MNDYIPAQAITIYRDSLTTYNEASENISRNGSVTAHPKTGAPLVNPCLAVRDSASKTIERFLKAYPDFIDAPAPAPAPKQAPRRPA